MLRNPEGSDSSVQGTNDDAQVSKLSCSKAGYFRDEFIHFFVRRGSRRSPLINRGYFSRHAALRQLLEGFLTAAEAAGQQPQVVVLGAGFDTTWFQLSRDLGKPPYRCLEVDFKEVTQRKAAIIAKEAALRDLLSQLTRSGEASGEQGEAAGSAAKAATAAIAASASAPSSSAPAPAPAAPGEGSGPGAPPPPAASSEVTSAAPPSADAAAPRPGPGPGLASDAASRQGQAAAAAVEVEVDAAHGTVRSPHYCLQPVDLRDVGALGEAVRVAGLDVCAPTYILSECVLVYMEPQHSSEVVSWAAATFPNALMAIYEQIRPDDAFGRQMVSNLEMRGCPLRGLPATPTLEAHCTRLTSAGWSWADARDMDRLYSRFVEAGERARTERLELFDELEEWHMIQEHYCIALGRNDRDCWLGGVGFDMPPPRTRMSLPPPPPAPAQQRQGLTLGLGGLGGMGGMGLNGGGAAAGGMRPPGLPPQLPAGGGGGVSGEGGRTLVVD